MIMAFYYAQIDENSICIAVTQAAGEIDLPNMIPIAFLDESLLGKLWQDGQWMDFPDSGGN
jgi:hypothetical protein